MATNRKLAGFDLIQTEYKNVQDHGIRADFLVPQTPFPRKRPVIVRFHGGGLITADSLYLDWFPQWLFDLAQKHGATPNYDLIPEAPTGDIHTDIEDFWWLRSFIVSDLLQQHSSKTQPDLTRILTAGESAGGLVTIHQGLAHPEKIRTCTAAYLCVDLTSTHFTTAKETPLMGRYSRIFSIQLHRENFTGIYRVVGIPTQAVGFDAGSNSTRTIR